VRSTLSIAMEAWTMAQELGYPAVTVDADVVGGVDLKNGMTVEGRVGWLQFFNFKGSVGQFRQAAEKMAPAWLEKTGSAEVEADW